MVVAGTFFPFDHRDFFWDFRVPSGLVVRTFDSYSDDRGFDSPRGQFFVIIQPFKEFLKF